MVKTITYDIRTPQGAGVGYRVERVAAPPIGGTCFANMHSVADLQSACSTAPYEHAFITELLKARGKVRGGEKQAQSEPITVKAQHLTFSRGATVKDVKLGRKGIIIKANAGYTAKSRTPVHKICDENGEVWLAKEKDLKLRH